MAHFAELDGNNIVTRVIVISNNDCTREGVEAEEHGVAFCKQLFGEDTVWKQTSYNGRIRGGFAGVGFTYMENVSTNGVGSTDIFIQQKPYESWSLGIQTARWYSPLGEAPALTQSNFDNEQFYIWDEDAYQADNTVGWALTSRT